MHSIIQAQRLELSPVDNVRAFATYLQGEECSLILQGKLSQNDACCSPYRELTAALRTTIVEKVEAEARKDLQEHYSG